MTRARAVRPRVLDALPGGAIDLRDAFDGPVEPLEATPAFGRALDAIADAGGGVLYVPPGTWVVDEPITVTQARTAILGAGMRASVISPRPGVAIHTVDVSAPAVTIERLTIRGVLESTPGLDQGYHAIRFGDVDADWVEIRDVVVEDARGYGIGFQKASYRDVVLENVSVHGSGADGIDFKNDEDDGGRCFLRHVTVERSGLLETDKAGIDVRGVIRLAGIEVLGVRAGNTGVRFREGEAGAVNGIGGYWSSMEGFYVEVSDDGAVGVAGTDLTGVQAAVGSVEHRVLTTGDPPSAG